jgi:hypothetical protein
VGDVHGPGGTGALNTLGPVERGVPHDRIHAQEPTHDRDRWRTGVIERTFERDGHCIVVVADGDEAVELTVTFAVRDLFVRRLDLGEGESPVGSRVWYRKRGQG